MNIKLLSRIKPVFHSGGVRIGRNSIIQSNCCVDKSVSKEFTEIEEDSVIGELTHIGHNVKTGKGCIIEPEVMIAGFVSIGDHARIGYNSSISDRITIGKKAVIMPGAVVTKDVNAESTLSGNFAIPSKKHYLVMRTIANGESLEL